jgi:predicted O-methyltransferase YrrM
MIDFYNFMGHLPWKIGTLICLLTGIDTIRVFTKAASNKTDAALQVIYQYRFRPWRLLWGLGDHLWQMSFNCRSVRSRGIFTRETIGFLLGAAGKKVHSKLTVVSLGSGSASQMLRGAADNHHNSEEIHLILVDNDPKALERGRTNARRLGIHNVTDCHETTVGKFLEQAEPASINLIEMVGLTDYFDDQRVHHYLRRIYDVLSKGGWFLGSNISSDEESDYAHKVACWPRMYYRPKEDIVESLEKAGFKKEEIWTGDCGLYTFWVVQKNG